MSVWGVSDTTLIFTQNFSRDLRMVIGMVDSTRNLSFDFWDFSDSVSATPKLEFRRSMFLDTLISVHEFLTIHSGDNLNFASEFHAKILARCKTIQESAREKSY